MKISQGLALLLLVSTISACVSTPLLSKISLRHDDQAIESKLRSLTPLGSTELQVLSYLEKEGLKPQPIWRGEIKPGSQYIHSTVPGRSFFRVLVGEYRNIFVTSVSAFYIFDQNQRLVEIGVRKETDAL